MDLPFTKFRADLFTSIHQIFDVTSILFNGLLLYLIIFQTAKSFRSYSIVLASVTLSDFLLGLTAGLAMTRCIPIGWGLAYQFHGLCRKVSPQFCMNVHAITAHCVAYVYSLLPLSFWYRHYVLIKKAPQPKAIALICFLFYIPAFISMVMFASSTSEPDVVRRMLMEHRNSSLYPDDPQQAALIGYESIFQKTTLAIIIWICLPIFPGYIAAIFYRTRIMQILHSNPMSKKTKEAQKKLVKALTIQAILPLFMMSQASVYIWRQFQLPSGDSVPYFEEWVFLLMAIVSSINPCITIHYVLPYREKVLRIFWLLRPLKRISPMKNEYKVQYEQNVSNTRTKETKENPERDVDPPASARSSRHDLF